MTDPAVDLWRAVFEATHVSRDIFEVTVRALYNAAAELTDKDKP